MEQHQQTELASTAQQAEARATEAEARVAEAELEMGSKLQALSELVDHTAKAGSQAMSHMSRLEAQTEADIQGRCLSLSFQSDFQFLWCAILSGWHSCASRSYRSVQTDNVTVCMLSNLPGSW